MKLKTLVIVVALLGLASALVYFAQRPAPPVDADPRVGGSLLAADQVEKAQTLRLTNSGQTVELARQSDGPWRVTSFHDLPADFAKLSRFIKDLTDARIERVVTRNPELLGRLDFNETSIALIGPDGADLWEVDLGRTAEGGGRFVRFEGENKAYLARVGAWIDATPRNWADTRLLELKPEQVARVELTWPEGATLAAQRETAEAPFTADSNRLRQAPLTSLLTTLSNLRFTEAVPTGGDEAEAARPHQRTIRLTTFDGKTVTVRLARKPAPPAPEPASEEEKAAPPPPPPAGPVFVEVDGPAELAPLVSASDRLDFKVADYAFTSLPADPAALQEPAEAPAPAASPAAPPAPVAPTTTDGSPAESAPAPSS